MMIGRNSSGAGYGMFYDMYTIQDGKLVQVVCGGERDTYELCKNNIIRYDGSSGAAHSSDTYCTYADGKLNMIECVLYDGSYGGTRDPYDGIDNDYFLCDSIIDAKHGIPITTEEAKQIKGKYKKVGFEFTCFSTVVYE